MKYILVLFMIGMSLSCKKEAQTVPPPLAGSSNKIEGDIIWGGITSTHFINLPAEPSHIYAYFTIDTTFNFIIPFVISMTGYHGDTSITFQIANPNLKTPGVYNFQDLDSIHVVSSGLLTGHIYLGPNPPLDYYGKSWSNKGRLTIDTISENHISGSIDSYCYRENRITNIPDTNEVHLLFRFSGDLRRD